MFYASEMQNMNNILSLNYDDTLVCLNAFSCMYTYGLFTIPLIFITLGPVESTSAHVISWHWTEDDGVVQQCMYVSFNQFDDTNNVS